MATKHIFVKSHFRSQWTGVVLDSQKRSKQNDLIWVLVLLDKNGNPMKKRVLKILDKSWVTILKNVEIDFNQDWLDVGGMRDEWELHCTYKFNK